MRDRDLNICNTLSGLLKEKGITEAELARRVGLRRATINRITHGITPDPRSSTLQAIAKFFNISIDQLLGNQPICTQHTTAKNRYKKVPILSWQEVPQWNDITNSHAQVLEQHLIESPDGAPEGDFVLSMTGDSMQPLFNDGCMLVVCTKNTPDNKDFVIATIRDREETLCRQLIIDGKYKILKPLNPIFPVLSLMPDDLIVGTVIQSHNYFYEVHNNRHLDFV